MARGFAKFAQAIGNAFSLVTQFIDGLVGMERGIKILAGAFALLTLSFSPFLAGLAAIILLLDDIAVFRAGGDSVIGELVKAFEDLPDFAKILGIGAGGATLLTFLGSLTKALGALAIPAAALAIPLASVVASLTFLANAPEFGKKIAEAIDKTEGGQKLGDALLDIRDTTRTGGIGAGLAIGGLRAAEALTGININNNNTYNINGLNAQEIGGEVQRSQKVINQEALNRVQASQGNSAK